MVLGNCFYLKNMISCDYNSLFLYCFWIFELFIKKWDYKLKMKVFIS